MPLPSYETPIATTIEGQSSLIALCNVSRGVFQPPKKTKVEGKVTAQREGSVHFDRTKFVIDASREVVIPFATEAMPYTLFPTDDGRLLLSLYGAFGFDRRDGGLREFGVNMNDEEKESLDKAIAMEKTLRDASARSTTAPAAQHKAAA